MGLKEFWETGSWDGAVTGPQAREVSMRDRERFFFLMGMMFKSGQTSVSALKTVAKAFGAEGNKQISAALAAMAQKVSQGRSLSKAMEAEPVLFLTVHRAAILAGEASNRMQQAFEILRVLEDKKIEASKGGMAELLTPALLAIMSLVSLFNTGLNTLPVMAEVREQQGKALGWLPQFTLDFTSFMAAYWYIFLSIVVVTVIALYSFRQTANGQYQYDNFLLNIPVLGLYISYKTYSQMLLYFPHLIESGVKPKQMTPIMEALATNVALKRKIETFNQTINTGGKMSQAMDKAGFPAIAVTPVAVSENYAGRDDNVNDVMMEGMHHSYTIMERVLDETQKKFIGIASSGIWIFGGGVMMVEMMSIVLTQS